jgi:hypothetical protein
MAFENFTVNVVSFTETAGDDWTQNNPSVSLTITPNTGYSIDVINFSAIAPLPSYVNTVVFNQNGTNIDCVITYTTPSIMPSADVLVSLCIQGYASETPIIVVGTAISGGLTNVSTPAPGDLPLSFSSSGNWDTSATVFTQAVIASPGYFFPTAPNLSINQGKRKDYTITSIESLDSEGRLVQVTFSVSYKFPVDNTSGDEIILTANAIEYYDPDVEITSYQFNNTNVVNAGGETRTFTIYGIEGANWDLQCVYTPGNINIVNTSGTIDATGQAVISVVFPATVNINRTFTFTLTGDLASTFDTANGQTSTPFVAQWKPSTLGLVFSTTDAAVTVGPISNITYFPFVSVPRIIYTVTATSTNPFVRSTIKGDGSSFWSNQGIPVAPQNFEFEMLSQEITINNSLIVGGTSTLSATVIVSVDVAGNIDATSTLNLDNILA